MILKKEKGVTPVVVMLSIVMDEMKADSAKLGAPYEETNRARDNNKFDTIFAKVQSSVALLP